MLSKSVVCISLFGLLIYLAALVMQIVSLALPYWLILPNIPSFNYNFNQMYQYQNEQPMYNQNFDNEGYNRFSSTFYSGLWMFCGYTADTDVFVDHRFCMPAEIEHPIPSLLVIKFNGFVGHWRYMTRNLGLAAAGVTLITIVGSVVAMFGGCSAAATKRICTIVWFLTGSIALIVTCACALFFIISFEQSESRMLYNAGGTTVFERRPYISFYLFAGSIVVHLIGQICAGLSIRLSFNHGSEDKYDVHDQKF